MHPQPSTRTPEPADEARRTLRTAGADMLPRPPWTHPDAPPDDVALVRYALWLANRNVGSAPEAELRAGLRLLSSARAELDALESALLFVARAEGLTWPAIAADLGLRSPQAAQQRYRRITEQPAPASPSDGNSRPDEGSRR